VVISFDNLTVVFEEITTEIYYKELTGLSFFPACEFVLMKLCTFSFSRDIFKDRLFPQPLMLLIIVLFEYFRYKKSIVNY
jgi:hypothetical protein